MGVTAIAAVNGRDAYERRYEETREILEDKPRRRRRKRGASMRRATPNRVPYPKGGKPKTKAAYIRYQRRYGRSAAQAENDWERSKEWKAKGAPKKKKAAKKRPSARKAAPKKRAPARKKVAARRPAARKAKARRVYGKGKYKTHRAVVGDASRPTYLYTTKKGHLRKIPKHAYLGYGSATEMRAAHSKNRDRRRRDEKRWGRAEDWRQRAAKATRGGRSPFTPNRTITYQEWEEEMKANARRRRRKKTTKKRATKGRSATTLARKRPVRRRSAAAKKRAPARRVRRRAGYPAHLGRWRYPVGFTKAAANKPRRRKAKRRVAKRRPVRRNRFLRNADSYMSNFTQVLKAGGIVAVGFVAQKAATYALSKAGFLNSLPAGLQSYKSSVSGLAVALIAVPLAAKFTKGDASASKLLGAGVGAAFVHTLIKDVISNMAPEYAEYLGDYTNAEGSPQYSGYGSYYEFEPHQVFSGMGEYYETQSGMSGMGALPQLYQDAAGYGQMDVNQLTQAAAGMGAHGGSAQLTQAAAGVGEYIIQGGKGIGEYEEVTPQYSAPTTTDEGISPDLTSAEYALSIAEAAAGVGAFGDITVPLQSTVNPMGQPEAIPDMPGGSRAGTFAGQNGVFG